MTVKTKIKTVAALEKTLEQLAEILPALKDSTKPKGKLWGEIVQGIEQLSEQENDTTASDNLHSAIIESLPESIFRKDLQGRFTFANNRYCQQHQITEQELIGKTDFDLYSNEVATKRKQEDSKVLREKLSLETLEDYITPDGKNAHLQLVRTPTYDSDGQINGIQGIFWDVTARQRRSEMLQTASEVSRSAGSILDVNQLIDTAVNLIRDKFDFYYTGLFLVDNSGQWAVLRAGTGEAGRVQLEKNHRLKIGGKSMIGWSIENHKARIALDIGQEAVHFQNPHLPDTRSEMALPLVSRDEAIGALTVQSVTASAFSDDDITLLQTMADQLANSIQNAHFFEEVTQARKEAEEHLKETVALQQLSQDLSKTLNLDEITDAFARTITKVLGFEYVQVLLVNKYQYRIKTFTSYGLPENANRVDSYSLSGDNIMADIIKTGRTDIIIGWDDRLDKEIYEAENQAEWVRVFTPITLREENIGLVETGFNRDKNASISQSQIFLLRTFIDQTALAIDNARRYEISQHAARREALIKEITTKVRSSTNMDIILQTAVVEVGTALNGNKTYVQMIEQAEQVAVTGRKQLPGYVYEDDDIYRTDYLSQTTRLAIDENQVGVSTNRNEATNSKELVTPIKLYGKTIGVLGVENSLSDEEWSTDDIGLLEEVSTQVALAIENSLLIEESRLRSQELSILFDTSRQLSETVEGAVIYEVLCKTVINYLKADLCNAALLSNRGDGLDVNVEKRRNEVGDIVDQDENWFEAVTDIDWLRLSLKSSDVIIGTLEEETLGATIRNYMEEETAGIKLYTLAIFPIIVRNKLIGILNVGHRRRRAYNQDELQMAQAIIAQVTVAIENTNLFRRTEEALAEAQNLYTISRSLVESSNLDDIFEVVLSNVKAYGVDRVSISLLEKSHEGDIEAVTIAASWDRDPDKMLPIGTRFSTNKYSLVHAFAKPPFKPMISEDLSNPDVQDERMDDAFRVFMNENLNATTMFSTPMFLGIEYKGVLSISTRTPHSYSDQEVRVYQTLADQSIITIENHSLLQQTREALKETELFYKATRNFAAAQHAEELLLTLVNSLGDVDIDRIVLTAISATAGDGTIKTVKILAGWDNDIEGLTIAETEVSSDALSFIADFRKDEPRIFNYNDMPEKSQKILDQRFGAVRSIMSMPLVVGQTWLGVLVTASRTEDFVFEPHLIDQISTLAGPVAVVLRNLQLAEETRVSLYQSEVLSELGQELLQVDTANAIYDVSLKAIADTKPERGAAIFIYDEVTGGVEMEIVAAWNNPDNANNSIQPVTPGMRFSSTELGLESLLKSGQTVISENVAVDKRFSETLKQILFVMQIGSFITVPIWLNREVGGFILISNQTTSPFPEATIHLYEDIARQTSVALENSRLFEEARHRASLLQAAAEISQAASAYLEVDTLMEQTVNLIQNRFNYSYAAIFIVDDYKKYAVIKAATGEAGQQMLAEQYSLAVDGKTVVGVATQNGKPEVALDVKHDEDFLFNPLLPNTRSEIAMPLISRGNVIGALNIHSAERNAFSENDIAILQSMANQLGNAIEVANSYEESKQALANVQRLNDYYLREQWSAFLKGQEAITGYNLTEEGLQAANEETWQPEMKRVTETKQPLIISATEINGDGKEHPPLTTTTPQLNKLIAPLALPQSDLVIGTVDFEIKEIEDEAWQEDIMHIIEAVTNQTAQSIEATRLFEQTQVAREEAESLYKVGRTLVAAESEKEMFHTVLEAMLSTLGLSQGGILFFEDNRRFGRLFALFEDGKPVESGLRFPITDNLSFEKLIKTKKPLAIEDVATDPLVATVRDINRERGIASLLLVPIISNDQVIGAIGADALGEKHLFTAREINLASSMADQLSLMLQNRRLLGEAHRHTVQLQASADVGRVATSILDQDMMLEQAVNLIKERFKLYHVQIFLINQKDELAVLHKSTGIAGQKLLAEEYTVPIDNNSVVGEAALSHKPVALRAVDIVDKDPRLSYHDKLLPDSKAVLAIPLLVGKVPIGILDVHSTIPNDFNEEDIATLGILAAQLAIAIQNARVFREQQETAERLKEIDKLKTQFLANMSHELRTPLNSIIGFSRVILKGIDGPLTDLQKTDLTSIHQSGQHLLSLINNILDLSKIEAGKMELNFDEVEINPIIKSVMSTALALIKDKSVKLAHEVNEDLPVIWADPTRIRQVILNLVSNACKFTEKGTIVLRAFADRGKMTVSVTDPGVGIPKDQLGSVFEEFTQVDGSTTRKVGGTGLGLPISRHFIEMHKGQIWVESTPGRGSTFSFAVPIKPPEEEQENIDDTIFTEEISGKSRVVAAIDDDPRVIELYKRFLDKKGYTVVGISDSYNALEQVKELAPYAVLLDIVMPDKDGWGVIRELKNEPLTKDIPVIMCSIVSDKNRGFSLGATDYLIKPIVESELLNALSHLNVKDNETIKVLVIDDQADDILLIRRLLEAQQNYVVMEAKNGIEGLKMVENNRPDLIILDLTMPEMDGFTVIETLKTKAETRTIPIVIVSAKELSAEEHLFLNGQVEVLLHKGLFTETKLLEDVNQALERIR